MSSLFLSMSICKVDARLFEDFATYGYSSMTSTSLSLSLILNTYSKAAWKDMKEDPIIPPVLHSNTAWLKFSRFCFSLLSTPIKYIAFLSSKMPFSFYFLKNKPYICRLKYHRIFKVKKLTLKINNNTIYNKYNILPFILLFII